jgi:microsomal dipeptidase-like Zn-dependent dipeptidase
LSDSELLAIKNNGGVVQIVAFSNYLRPVPAEIVARTEALRKQFSGAELAKRTHDLTVQVPKATLAQYVDHIDYAVKKIGIDHVGIASDFNHGAGVVGFNDESEAVNLTAELLKRGYKEAEIAKLWGGNFLRVWERAQGLKLVTRK